MNARNAGLLVIGILVTHGTAIASPIIIDDKADFVGDYTVIDFETYGDGTPLILREGGWIELPPQEYGSLGVIITSSENIFGNNRAIVGNSLENPQSDLAHALSGSPPNVIAVPQPNGFLRFDFETPVNAVGLNIRNWSEGDPVVFQVYGVASNLIESVQFDEQVIDGVVFGRDFGNSFDIHYGFAGLFSPEAMISHVVISEDQTSFDDLYFGVIPEPATLLLLLGAVALVTRFRRHRVKWVHCQLICGCALVFGGLETPLFADNPVSGQVNGWVDLTEGPICGDNGWSGCVNPELQSAPLNGVLVCVEGGQCDYTSARCTGNPGVTCTEDADCDPGEGTCEDGWYKIAYEGTDPVLTAQLNGVWANVGALDFQDPYWVFVSADAIGPQYAPELPFVDVDFVFNPQWWLVPEIETAKVTAYYYAQLAHDFFKERRPDFVAFDVPLKVLPSFGAQCETPGISWDPPGPYIYFPKSALNSCTNFTARSSVTHEYAHFIRFNMGVPDTNAFEEGFADAYAILVHDDPIIFPNWTAEGSFGRSYDFTDPLLRKQLDTACPGEIHACGEVLAGIWWDIKLNMQSYFHLLYQQYEPSDCPVDSERFNVATAHLCGLEVTRQLFVDWAMITEGRDFNGVNSTIAGESLALEILRADDDDTNLLNSTPHFTQICKALGSIGTSGDLTGHGIECPCDCGDEQP
ncbi:MAG: PEP-CTERM sorting domain-containing protein, partial [Phycisphaerales bacterium]